MKVGTIIKGNCRNCFDNVELEFRYEEHNIYGFVCLTCGTYNYLTEEEMKSETNIKTIR